MITERRAENSGVIPLMLRHEHMGDKTKWAQTLRDAYAEQLKVKRQEAQDVDGLIAVGLLPDITGARGGVTRTFAQFIEDLENNFIAKGILDESILKAKHGNRKLTSVLYNHQLRPESVEINIRPFLKNTEEVANAVKLYSDAIEDGLSIRNDYFNRRFRNVHKLTTGRYGDKPFDFPDTGGIADLRQFTLNRKIGSSAYYYGGDSFFSNADFLHKFSSYLETDPAMLAASINRGIGLDAADAKNLSQVFDGITGITTKDIIDLVEQFSTNKSNSTIRDSLTEGLNHLRAAREQLGGGKPAQKMSENAFTDGLNRHSNSSTMVLFGGNMGLAMLAETATTTLLKVAPEFVKNPVRTTAHIVGAMVQGMSPMRKTKFLRFLNYSVNEMRNQHSARSIDRSTDVSLGVAGQHTNRTIDGLGTLAYRAGLGSVVQGFNKDLSARLHMENVFDLQVAANKMRNVLAEARSIGYVYDKKSFKSMARKVGFGRLGVSI